MYCFYQVYTLKDYLGVPDSIRKCSMFRGHLKRLPDPISGGYVEGVFFQYDGLPIGIPIWTLYKGTSQTSTIWARMVAQLSFSQVKQKVAHTVRSGAMDKYPEFMASVMALGPPCQPFSRYPIRYPAHWDLESDSDDEGQRVPCQMTHSSNSKYRWIDPVTCPGCGYMCSKFMMKVDTYKCSVWKVFYMHSDKVVALCHQIDIPEL